MHTGRKNRRKNGKSRGYIVPVCLALSGTLMTGTATAKDFPLDKITNSYNSSDSKEYNKYQKVKVSDDGSTVTLHNIGVANGKTDNIRNNDTYYFNEIDASEKSIIIDWQNDPNSGDVLQLSPVRSKPDTNLPNEVLIRAKNFSISSNFIPTFSSTDPKLEGDRENRKRHYNKGLCVEGNGSGSITVDVSGTISLETGEFSTFTADGTIKVINFTELSARDTGLQKDAGDVIRNVGNSYTLIEGKPDSKITLVSAKTNRDDGRTLPVVQDASSQGITIRGGTISITREAEESHSIVFTGYYAKEGHIDIEGEQSVTIGTPDRKYEFAVQGFSQGNGFSTIDINTNSKGTVTINGRATAESAEVNIHYAGGGSLQNGDVLAAKSHQGSKDRFTEGDKLSYGGPGAKTGVMNLVFSGAGAGMKGNMTAEEGSSITADFSGDNAFFNGNITAQKGERFTEGEKSRSR